MEAEIQAEQVVEVEVEVESDETTFKNTFRLKEGEWTADLVGPDGEMITGVKLLEHDFELREEVLSLEMDAELSNSSDGVNEQGEEVTYTTTYSRTEEGIVVAHSEQPRVPEVEDPNEVLETEDSESEGGFSLVDQTTDLFEHEEVGSFAMEYQVDGGELFPLGTDATDGTKTDIAFSAGLLDEQREEHQTATAEAINGGTGSTEIRGLEDHTDTTEIYVISEYLKVGETAEGLPVVQVTSHLETRPIPELPEEKGKDKEVSWGKSEDQSAEENHISSGPSVQTDAPTGGRGIEAAQAIPIETNIPQESRSNVISEPGNETIPAAKTEITSPVQSSPASIESQINIESPRIEVNFAKIEIAIPDQPTTASTSSVIGESTPAKLDASVTLKPGTEIRIKASNECRSGIVPSHVEESAPIIIETVESLDPQPEIYVTPITQIEHVLHEPPQVEATDVVSTPDVHQDEEETPIAEPTIITETPSNTIEGSAQNTPTVEAISDVTAKVEASDAISIDEKLEVQMEVTDLTTAPAFSEPTDSEVAAVKEAPKPELSAPIQTSTETIDPLPVKRVEVAAAPVLDDPSREVASTPVQPNIQAAPIVSPEPRQIVEETDSVRQPEEVLPEAYEALIETPSIIQAAKPALTPAAKAQESWLADFGANALPETDNTWRTSLDTATQTAAEIEQTISSRGFVPASDNSDSDDLEITFDTSAGSTSKRRPRRTRTAAA